MVRCTVEDRGGEAIGRDGPPFGSGRWQAVGSVLWGGGNSDVAFHDHEIFMINAGVVYRFGARAAPASAAQ
jgi:hypothetical protein